MRRVIVVICWILLALFVSSLPGAVGLAGRSILMSALAYLLFFHRRYFLPESGLIAMTAVFELTGFMHFGAVSFLSLCFWFSTLLFSEKVRFTSPYVRYIVSLLVLTLLLSFIGYPLAGFLHRLIILLLALIPVIAGTLMLSVARETPEYEFS